MYPDPHNPIPPVRRVVARDPHKSQPGSDTLHSAPPADGDLSRADGDPVGLLLTTALICAGAAVAVLWAWALGVLS